LKNKTSYLFQGNFLSPNLVEDEAFGYLLFLPNLWNEAFPLQSLWFNHTFTMQVLQYGSWFPMGIARTLSKVN